jgi:hypothetical protein
MAAPWLPVVVCAVRVGLHEPWLAVPLFIIAPYAISALVFVNISRGISVVSGCSLWKALISLLLTLCIIVVVILFCFFRYRHS